MPHFLWDSVIMHNQAAVEVHVFGATEADENVSDEKRAMGLVGAVQVYARNLFEDEDESRVVNTYEELRALSKSARIYRDFSNLASGVFDTVSTEGALLADSHKTIHDDVKILGVALYYITVTKNSNNNRVWLSGATDKYEHQAWLDNNGLSRYSLPPTPEVVFSSSRSASPEATVLTVVPTLEGLANSISSRVDRLAKLAENIADIADAPTK